ncbi:uncharacterized protein [Choristoneura fumiferana]|uniref:uncharacterized protein n=1 Tax=Choristoneura fumiferana TaxID=7141 RepID=UPI003D153858
MVNHGSRSRERRRSGAGSRDRKRHKSRKRRDLRSRSKNRRTDLRHGSADPNRCDPSNNSFVRDRRDSRDTDIRRSRGRARRRSRSVSYVRRRNGSRSSTRDRSRRRRSRSISRSRGRPSRIDGGYKTRTPSPEPLSESGVACSEASTFAQALMQAIKTMHPVKSQHYYVSNFDPSINNIEAWCEEVDRARVSNGWNDHECLSRVASCLKGDAKIWLSEWVTNDRTWSNFKREFKSLCPSKLDFANILFNAMNATSDKYPTYAEYARRTLLRLRIIQGLNDELRTLIVIRGIDNPQVRAAAANADLTPDTLVSFLSIYTKPNTGKRDVLTNHKKQPFTKPNNRLGLK